MLKDYFISHGIQTLCVVVFLVLLRWALILVTRRFARKFERVEHRTGLIVKHINYATIFLLLLSAILIWGVDFKNFGSVILSVFAVIGIGFFAQWSILSNITSGIIMFFIFPYKIGDYIKVHDKEHDYQGIIDDIKTFHLIIKTDKGETITYPNSLILQKGVSVLKPDEMDMVDELFHPEMVEDDKNVKEHPID
ncbi:MAG TPA: mechanosensitive ion channel [Flavobacteriaceae bacterium]|nr:mechanosensitive ion channel protein MscS [Flavobacteriaceae bacterium]MAM28529.1 mechanosensitive ion channel protein MscS [Flavobacteriaceae bacterium]MAY52718.1 mechanosensitive ion channel protein MscS [Flavobacteriaceae bacterium]HBR52749.1 mechanosensitive ion channel protein MscS [Flavobacteriaceae bacterium]HIB48644.1 mechanosensitive ion channel [Flavobacteriaceae bacterium]